MDGAGSEISLLLIHEVEVPGSAGLIGIVECPGRNEFPVFGIPAGMPKRDLDRDLRVITGWGAEALVSLIEAFEFELYGIVEIREKAGKLGIRWLHLPIAQGCVPDHRFEEAWETAGKELRQILKDGGRILLHCRKGMGRSGTIAARLLVELGMTPCEAFAAVRRAVHDNFPSGEQVDYILGCWKRAKG